MAPLTATALSAVEDRYAGVASGVNTTVARAAQLGAVAALPLAAGITGATYLDPVQFSDGFRMAMIITAGLSLAGALVAALRIRNPRASARSGGRGRPPPRPCRPPGSDGAEARRSRPARSSAG